MFGRISVSILSELLMVAVCIPLSAQQDTWQSVSARTASLYAEGQYVQALPAAQNALRIAEQRWGPKHANVANSLHNLGDVQRALGNYREAESSYRRALAINEELYGSESKEAAASLNDLYLSSAGLGDAAKSEFYCRGALQIRQKVLGPNHPDVAQSLNNLAAIYKDKGKYSEAEELLQRSIRIQENAFGADAPNLFYPIANLADNYHLQKNYPAAESYYRRALRIQDKGGRENDPNLVTVLNPLAWLCNQNGKLADAEQFLKRSLTTSERIFGPDSPQVASVLNNLGSLYVLQGPQHPEMYVQAEPLLQRALAIRERAPGRPDVAETLANLEDLYRSEGKYTDLESLQKRSLSVAQAKKGQQSSATAKELLELARSKQARGGYAEAELLLKQVLEIVEKAPDSDKAALPAVLNNLAESYREQGRYADAEQLYLRSLRLNEESLGSNDPTLASMLNNLGLLYKQVGRYAEAEPLHLRALTITTKAYGKDDLRVAITLNCMSGLYMDQGRYSDAAPLARRSLEIRQKLLNPGHPDIGTALNNLALVYSAEGKYSEAQELAEQALDIDKKALGSDAPVVAIDLVNLAALSKKQNKAAAAESFYVQALGIQEKSLGPDHPEIASTSMQLARLYYSQNDYLKAAPLFKQAFANLTRQFQYHFTYMSEKDRLAFLHTVDQDFPTYFSFCFKYREQDPALLGGFYDLLLWEKGLVAESMASFRGRIATSRDQEALQLLDQLAARRADVARIRADSSQSSTTSRADTNRLEQEANQIERELVKRSGIVAEHNRLAAVTWRDVQKALGPKEAAVEFVRLPFEDALKQTPTIEYLALVVTPRSASSPALVFLGEADELEYAALQDYWRRVDNKISTPASGLPFYRVFWKPLESQFAGIERVYVSPDGLLNEISFAAVPTEDARLLIEKYDVRTVLSTKDLLRKTQLNADRSAVLIGDPQFDLSADQEAAVLVAQNTRSAPAGTMTVVGQGFPAAGLRHPDRAMRSPEQGVRKLNRLPGTAQEVKAVGDLLTAKGWRVQSFAGQYALEETIKRVNGPRVLHVATHGYFDPDQRKSGNQLEDPMLRSGLFFAGANRVLSGAPPAANMEDGILTAYEATGLNLQGTEVVVLSACETGLGSSTNGEGVFGLRRALQEAGAQAVMMSMWKVPDTETQKLMTLFYQKWLSGKDKHEALREAQLELRKDIMNRWQQDRPHDWAAFVLVGP